MVRNGFRPSTVCPMLKAHTQQVPSCVCRAFKEFYSASHVPWRTDHAIGFFFIQCRSKLTCVSVFLHFTVQANSELAQPRFRKYVFFFLFFSVLRPPPSKNLKLVSFGLPFNQPQTGCPRKFTSSYPVLGVKRELKGHPAMFGVPGPSKKALQIGLAANFFRVGELPLFSFLLCVYFVRHPPRTQGHFRNFDLFRMPRRMIRTSPLASVGSEPNGPPRVHFGAVFRDRRRDFGIRRDQESQAESWGEIPGSG